MNKSESITNIAAALAKAQLSIGAASKDAQNPFFKSRYADLGSVMAVCKEPLLANGISVMQLVSHDGEHQKLETILLHASGEYIGSAMRIVASKQNDPQAMGSAITYARRYALQAMVFIPSVDDDAEWVEKALRNRPDNERAAIQAIINQHLEEAETATPERAKQLHGLAAELRCKLADMDAPIQTPEPQPQKAAPTKRAKKTPTPPANPDWTTVICHIGKDGGLVKGKTIGDLFAPTAPEKNIQSLYTYFETQVGTSVEPADMELWNAVQQGHKAWKDAKAAESTTKTPEVKASTQTPPAASNAAQEPNADAWRAFKLVSRTKTLDGRRLDDLSPAEMKGIREYLDKVDWQKATEYQKHLLEAVTDMEDERKSPDLAGHTRKLDTALLNSSIDPADFISVAIHNKWISQSCLTVADISESEAESLLNDWENVELAVQSDQLP